MNQTFQNSAQVLSVGIFFTLLIVGLAGSLPAAAQSGLEAHGLSAEVAGRVAHAPPISILFAAFLGYNPIQGLVGAHALSSVGAHARAVLTGPTFFPHLISGPFREGLHTAFLFAIVACLIAAAASLMRGGRYEYTQETTPEAAIAEAAVAQTELPETVVAQTAPAKAAAAERSDPTSPNPDQTRELEEQHAR